MQAAVHANARRSLVIEFKVITPIKIVSQSREAIFSDAMHQYPFGGQAPSGSAGGAYSALRCPIAEFSRRQTPGMGRRMEENRRGWKGREKEGREGKGREGKGKGEGNGEEE